MNNSSDPRYAQSHAILVAQFESNLIWVILSLISIFMGTGQMVLIVLWKPLRTMEQSLVFLIAAGDAFKGYAFLFTAVKRLYLAGNNNGHEVISQRECMYWLMAIINSTKLIQASMFLIGCDRLLALSLPIWYSNRKRSIKVICIVISIAVGWFFSGWIFFDSRQDVLVLACTMIASPSASVTSHLLYFDNICCALTIAVNIACGLVVYARWRRAKAANENMQAFKSQIQLAALKTLIVVNILFLFSLYSSAIFRWFINALPISEATRSIYTPIGGSLTLIRGTFDFLIYIFMCREYRQGFRVICARNKCARVADGSVNDQQQMFRKSPMTKMSQISPVEAIV